MEENKPSKLLNVDFSGLGIGPFYQGFRNGKTFIGVLVSIICTIIIGIYAVMHLSEMFSQKINVMEYAR